MITMFSHPVFVDILSLFYFVLGRVKCRNEVEFEVVFLSSLPFVRSKKRKLYDSKKNFVSVNGNCASIYVT